MDTVNQRVANFVKFFSMLMVFGCLLYMYAYTSGKENSGADHGWFFELSSKQIFFFGLAIFAIFNLVMNMAISTYKNSQIKDGNSIIFGSEEKKEKLLLWFTYVSASVNVLIATIIAFLALVRLNEQANISGLAMLPTAAMILFIVACFGVFRLLIQK